MKSIKYPILLLFVAAIWIGTGCQSSGPGFSTLTPSGSDVTEEGYKGVPHRILELKGDEFTAITLTNQIKEQWLQSPTNLFRLGPGDVIEIESLDDGSRSVARIGPDGKIYYGLLPGLFVWDLTLSETKQLLEDNLQRFLRIKPELVVTLVSVESKNMWILGNVNQPGVYPLSTPMTILEAITLAGGPTVEGRVEETVDWANSFVLRQGDPIRIDFYGLLRRGDLTQNIYLEPDDFLYLRPLTEESVFLMGAIRRPGSLPYKKRLTLLQAIMMSGGLMPWAYGSRVAIVRGSLDNPRIAVVDYKDIIKGKSLDVLLQPGDIIHIPFSPYQYVGELGISIIKQFVSTMALNEGRYAVGGTTPVGISVYQ